MLNVDKSIFDTTSYIEKWRNAGIDNNVIIKKFEEIKFNLGIVFIISYQFLYFFDDLYNQSKSIINNPDQYLLNISDEEKKRREYLLELSNKNKPWDYSYFERVKKRIKINKLREDVKLYVNEVNKILNPFLNKPVGDYIGLFQLYSFRGWKIFFSHPILSWKIDYFNLTKNDEIRFLKFMTDIDNEIFILKNELKEHDKDSSKNIDIRDYSYAQNVLMGKKEEYSHIIEALLHIKNKEGETYLLCKNDFFIINMHRNLFVYIVKEYCKRYNKLDDYPDVEWSLFNNCIKDDLNKKVDFKEVWKKNISSKKTPEISNLISEIEKYVVNNLKKSLNNVSPPNRGNF